MPGRDEPSEVATSDLDLLDPDEFFADYDRRARERRQRRHSRRRFPRPRLASGALASAPAGRLLLAATTLLAAATVIGLLVLWPGASRHTVHSFAPSVPATATRSTTLLCGQVRCRELEISVHGQHSRVTLGPLATAPAIAPGTPIRVSPVPLARGQPAPPGYQPWQFVDIDRHGSLLWLSLALLTLAVIVIRLRGLLAALGVALSLLLVTTFLVPAILAGEPALPVALVCALAVMFTTLVLTNGFGPQMLAAALGIGLTLLLICLLALLAVHFAHIDGKTDELSAYLGTINPNLSLQGIVLAGMVVGALGVLADTAVTQASAVMALRHANPKLTPHGLYHGAFRVGRDHLSATIHTLVLAYVGASLPLLLITRSTGVSLTDALSTQTIAQPIVATLVGCLGLVCAVPLTTGLAVLLAARVPPSALDGVHTHTH
jgi:uncharacterized membrane protein